jgi:hypothetical protein
MNVICMAHSMAAMEANLFMDYAPSGLKEGFDKDLGSTWMVGES